ncbi:MAG: efflux RND transporter periplasmic adaptor subunit [Patescibacteria group bacterium]|nr:efflux RND transporter periplasmic adaptor subunit [Patescibacteria group bacterium]
MKSIPKWGYAVIVVVLVAGVYLFFFRGAGAAYQFITVTQGSITETVSVTGNTMPTKSVSLGFQNTGTIARVNYSLGNWAAAGTVVAELNTANLSAALGQAQANLAVAEANLAALLAGTRPEQLAIDQSAVAQDQIALINTITSAYSVSDGAVHTSADQLFTNARTTDAKLVFIVPDAVLENTVVQERIALEPVLAAWSAQITSPSFSTSDPLPPALLAVQNLTQVSTFLNDVAAVLTKTGGLSAATLTTYQSNIATARTNVASALTALSSAKAALVSAQGTLALAQAGSTPESITAQQAQVAQAKAGVASAVANLLGAKIVAPISGVVTDLDAKVGQLASPGTPLVSIIGSGGFEVDAGVSETDIGKLIVGNKVTMTLDAFPNETFTGAVFYIAPAQTDTQGVISYQIKIAFDTADSRLKSGLTANVDIQTKRKDNVLILPQYAILQNDAGTFVQTLADNAATTSPITLGIQDQKGNVEILSGVTLGEQVINIGLKAP